MQPARHIAFQRLTTELFLTQPMRRKYVHGRRTTEGTLPLQMRAATVRGFSRVGLADASASRPSLQNGLTPFFICYSQRSIFCGCLFPGHLR
jgi:hypothetical protein